MKTSFGTCQAEALLEMGDSRGIAALITMMGSSELRGARKGAYEHFPAHVHVRFPFDAEADQNDREIDVYRQWWIEHRDDLQLQPRTGVFESEKPD